MRSLFCFCLLFLGLFAPGWGSPQESHGPAQHMGASIQGAPASIDGTFAPTIALSEAVPHCGTQILSYEATGTLAGTITSPASTKYSFDGSAGEATHVVSRGAYQPIRGSLDAFQYRVNAFQHPVKLLFTYSYGRLGRTSPSLVASVSPHLRCPYRGLGDALESAAIITSPVGA